MSIIIKLIIVSLVMIVVGGLLMFIKRKEATRYYCSLIWVFGFIIMALGAVPLLLIGVAICINWILI